MAFPHSMALRWNRFLGEFAFWVGWLSAFGAPTNGTIQFSDRLQHWAFRPIQPPAVPQVSDGSWPRNDLDAFILARLAREGLTPSPEADRRTLLRRLCFDLTGLPPTWEQIDAFLGASEPDSYEKWVVRLLESPQYGERWARHWLDVVHYGESHGYDKDKPRPNAWPFRDYVIRSFNSDKPWSQMVREQVAGDVLFPNDPDGTVALGFLAAGPWDFVGHVELPESKTDGLIARYNDRDDMVMTTMSSFLSLTVHCARCHDHKFDPISAHEYYALQAVFAGVDRAERPFDQEPAIHSRRRHLLAEQRWVMAEKKELDDQASRVTSPEIAHTDSELKTLREQLASLPTPGDSPGNGYHSEVAAKPDVDKWVQLDLAFSQPFDEVRLIPARPTDFPDTPGFGFPVRFRIEAADEDHFLQPQVLVDHTTNDFANPGDTAVVFKTSGKSGRYVRVTATRLWKRTGDYVFALAELEVRRGGENQARWVPVQALDSIESGRWGRGHLVDGFDSRHALDGAGESSEVAERRARLRAAEKQLLVRRAAEVDSNLPPEVPERRNHLTSELLRLGQALEALPRPQMVYAATSEFPANGNFHPAEKPRVVRFLNRGNVTLPAEEMRPGALACLPGLPNELEVVDPDSEGLRRAALARWLTDPRNDLLRRSIVNRVWQYHFGRGLVETPNDFGRLGALPSHPELLDWLAIWFRDHGESLKALHYLIVTSATYRQTSQSRPEAALVDADNRLLWRMNRSRLDAESLRDALLSASGSLESTMAGPSVQQFWFKDDHSPTYDYARFDVQSAAARRRSIYRFIVRSVPDPFYETMDCPDPSVLTPRRNSTLTPLQALSLLNNPFVLDQATQLARRLERECSNPTSRVTRLFELVLSRPPSSEETGQWTSYMDRYGLVGACRLLFNSNEFVFLD